MMRRGMIRGAVWGALLLCVGVVGQGAGEAPTAVPGPFHTLRGRITDAAGEPVAGAEISIVSASARASAHSNADGAYAVPLPAQGSARSPARDRVLVQHRERNLVAIARIPTADTPCDLGLSPGVAVRGAVQDGVQAPVADATVQLRLFFSPGRFVVLATTKTQQDGRFLFRAIPPSQSVELYVSGRTHSPDYARFTCPATGVREVAEVEVAPLTVNMATETLSGFVVDEAGEPTPGAWVQLRGDGQPYQAVEADGEGRFRLSGVVPGPASAAAYVKHNGKQLRGHASGQSGDEELRVVVRVPKEREFAPTPDLEVPVLGQDFEPDKAFYWRDFEDDEPLEEWSVDKRTVLTVGDEPQRVLGLFSPDTVTMGIGGLPAHRYVRLYAEVYCLLSWDGDHAKYGPDIFEMRIIDGPRVVFASFTNSFGSTQSYPMPLRHGAAGRHCGGRPLDLTMPREGKAWLYHTLYPVCLVIPHTSDVLRLGFAGIGLSLAKDEAWALEHRHRVA